MDETWVGLMEIVGPAILLVLLIWLVLRSRRGRKPDQIATDTDNRTEAATRELYRDEEERRREGTDGL